MRVFPLPMNLHSKSETELQVRPDDIDLFQHEFPAPAQSGVATPSVRRCGRNATGASRLQKMSATATMSFSASTAQVQLHLDALRRCTLCPGMHGPVVVGRPAASRVILIGQAPGDKEPRFGRPFAWTAGKTLFKWFETTLGWSEDETRDRIYFAAVCRCFPGKKPQGGDRVPDEVEIANCARWLEREFAILQPLLVLPVGKLAITQLLGERPLVETVGRSFPTVCHGQAVDVVPLPHPSGASPWHRMEPGKTLLGRALALVADHPAVQWERNPSGPPAKE
jgi:uracil-DNA glycosylase